MDYNAFNGYFKIIQLKLLKAIRKYIGSDDSKFKAKTNSKITRYNYLDM